MTVNGRDTVAPVSDTDAIVASFPAGSALSRPVTASLVFAVGAETTAGVHALDDLTAAVNLLLTAGAAVVRLDRVPDGVRVTVQPVSRERFDEHRAILERLSDATYSAGVAELTLRRETAAPR